MDSWLKTASTRRIQLNGLKTMLVVGTLLNLINQGSVILSGDWQALHLPKLIFTYCVPYAVSVFAGTQALRSK